MKYGINAKINAQRKVTSSCLEDYKTIFNYFLGKQPFYIQQQAKIWFEMLAVSPIRRNEKKNKFCKWKTCWVLLQNPYIINEKQHSPYMDYPTPHFYQKFLILSSFYNFSKSNPFINKGVDSFFCIKYLQHYRYRRYRFYRSTYVLIL